MDKIILVLMCVYTFSVPSIAGDPVAEIGEFSKLPLEVRHMIYNFLDPRGLGNLELASNGMNHEIANAESWNLLAVRMGLQLDPNHPEVFAKQRIRSRLPLAEGIARALNIPFFKLDLSSEPVGFFFF